MPVCYKRNFMHGRCNPPSPRLGGHVSAASARGEQPLRTRPARRRLPRTVDEGSAGGVNPRAGCSPSAAPGWPR